MSFIVDCEMELSINGKRVDCAITGHCTRDLRGAISCEPTSVRSPEGHELLGVVPNDMLEPMRVRLWSAALAERHPLGDGEEAAV